MEQSSFQARYDSVEFSGDLIANRAGRNLYVRFVKRTFDLVVALALLTVALPVMIVIALIVMTDFQSPVFVHTRVGKDGRKFGCLKFRSMRKDSNRLLRHIVRTDPTAAREWHTDQKLEHDPRITRIGRFLRATSLDELPQLFNVLAGHMSIVGPRPVTEKELDRYGPYLPAYLALRPGVTGLWQVRGRGTSTYDARVKMDAHYALTASLLGDLALAFGTVGVVLRKTGK